jgi:tryptophanyl-tRNA synthetase
VVPVGEDQVQHIETSRVIARKFNNRYGAVFPEPMEKVSIASRVRGLDGQAKMSKSLNNQIDVIEAPDSIVAKLKVAVTDPARKRRADPGNPEVCNIYALHGYFSTQEQCGWAAAGCRSAGIGCFDCKKVLWENIITQFAPIRARAIELLADPGHVSGVLDQGAERCRDLASGTMKRVKEAMGLV